MYEVRWLEVALNELAALWLAASSAERQAITAATHALEARLAHDPEQEGESRSGTSRITFAPPLAVWFRIDAAEQAVTIFHVRSVRVV
jgi:hypothetical protein